MCVRAASLCALLAALLVQHVLLMTLMQACFLRCVGASALILGSLTLVKLHVHSGCKQQHVALYPLLTRQSEFVWEDGPLSPVLSAGEQCLLKYQSFCLCVPSLLLTNDVFQGDLEEIQMLVLNCVAAFLNSSVNEIKVKLVSHSNGLFFHIQLFFPEDSLYLTDFPQRYFIV